MAGINPQDTGGRISIGALFLRVPRIVRRTLEELPLNSLAFYRVDNGKFVHFLSLVYPGNIAGLYTSPGEPGEG